MWIESRSTTFRLMRETDTPTIQCENKENEIKNSKNVTAQKFVLCPLKMGSQKHT